MFYLATPPGIVGTIVHGLGIAGFASDRSHARIVEKPFGHDLASAVALNGVLTAVFNEAQIYRIDHYLGKETVQNILAFRFANGLFEPIWDRRYIDYGQITVAEQVGVEHRGAYYEHAGALRDMIQNHLMQVLCLIAMEPKVSFQETFKSRSPEAYETLLADVMTGDATLFTRADQVAGSWSAIAPILNVWEKTLPTDLPNYPSGT